METIIRLATPSDEKALSEIYAAARAYMAKEGNPSQWGSDHPLPSLIKKDIEEGCLYVICKDNAPHAAFSMTSHDECYEDEGTSWAWDKEYLVIHSLGSDGTLKHVFDKAVGFALSQSKHLRIDTHKDNKTMLALIERWGFSGAGYCHMKDGTIRYCFELNR